MNKSFISLALLLTVMAETAHADRAQANLAAGLSRHSEQRNIDARPLRGSGEVRREITRTNARGETAQRSQVITRDGEAGAIHRSVAGVTANGRSYFGDSTATATENGFTRESYASDSLGNARAGATVVEIDKEAGTLTKQMAATRTNRNGETKSVSGESAFVRTEDGYSGNSSMTNARGDTRTRSVDVSADKTAGTLTKTVNTAGPRGAATTTTQISRSKEADSSAE